MLRGDPACAHEASLRRLEFKWRGLAAGTSLIDCHPDQEAVVVLLGGSCTVTTESITTTLHREDVFRQLASACYVPPGSRFELAAITDTEAALCLSTARGGRPPFVVTPQQVKRRRMGRDHFQRDVFDIVGPEADTEHLIVGETLNPPGHWSSFPPHKHDADIPGQEVAMEEIYYFRVNPSDGFGFQRLYTPTGDRDTAIVVRDHVVSMIDAGYHPVSAMPGCTIYYLWFLAGTTKRLQYSVDPAFRWIERG